MGVFVAGRGRKRQQVESAEQELTPEIIDAVNRLREMQADDWAAFQTMSMGEIDAAIEGAEYPFPDVWGTEHYQLMHLAKEARKHEQHRRDCEWRMHYAEQQRRSQDMTKAAKLVREAQQLAGYAYAVEKDATPARELMEMPDVDAMSGGQLDVLLAQCQAELLNIGDSPERKREDSAALKLLKTEAGRHLARELDNEALGMEARRESARKVAQAVTAEIERREEERAAIQAELEEAREHLPEILRDLKNRLAQLEGTSGEQRAESDE